MTTYDVVQGTLEWHNIRRVYPTASNFGRIITPSKRQYSSQAAAYIQELIEESKKTEYYPKESDRFRSPAMQWGLDHEDEARAWYSFANNVDVQQVGFVVSDCGRFGCSPDGLIAGVEHWIDDDFGGIDRGNPGGLEIKCPELKRHRETVSKGVLPLEHKCQVHGNMIVCKRRWWDFVSYHPDDEPFQLRVVWDDFTDALVECLDEFWEHLKYAKEGAE